MLRRLALSLALLFALLVPSARAEFSGPPPFPPIFPPIINGNYYTPWYYGQTGSTTTATFSTSTTYCTPGVVQGTFHLDALSANVETPDSGGNIQLAIYATGSWGRPGVLITNTSSISVTSSGVVTGAVTAVQLTPGPYWTCAQADNTTVKILTLQSATGTPISQAVGAGTLADIFSTLTNLHVAGTFGTWANFTSSTSWTDGTSGPAPYVAFTISSVP